MAKIGWLVVASALTLTGPAARAQGVFSGLGGQKSKEPAAWIVYESKGGGFSILLPGKPKVASQPGKPFTTHTVRWEERNAKYSITYFDPPPDSIRPQAAEATMKRDRDLSVRDVKGTLRSETAISIPKGGEAWPGLASVFEDRSHTWTSRLYAVDGRMYALQVGYPKAHDRPEDAEKFFASFVVAERGKR